MTHAVVNEQSKMNLITEALLALTHTKGPRLDKVPIYCPRPKRPFALCEREISTLGSDNKQGTCPKARMVLCTEDQYRSS